MVYIVGSQAEQEAQPFTWIEREGVEGGRGGGGALWQLTCLPLPWPSNYTADLLRQN